MTAPAPILPPIADLHALIRRIDEEVDHLDRACMNSTDKREKESLDDRRHQLYERWETLDYLILSLPARTLRDATAQLSILAVKAWNLSDEHDLGEIKLELRRIRRALGSVLAVLVSTAGYGSMEMLFGGPFDPEYSWLDHNEEALS